MQNKIHLIGNAHLDPVWLWRWQEGFAEIKATFRSALDRMKEYDDFIFTTACAAYFMWIEEVDPAMFEEIRARVKEGRICLVGGWFIQPDCNIPSGESFARHALISQNYFLDRFGICAETGYNVDSFGHNGNIPMLLRQARMKNYIFMRPGPHEKTLPKSLFVWESADGSRVTAYRIPLRYNINEDYFHMFGEIEQMDEGTEQMAFYGVGNHGGGPTVSLIERIKCELSDRFVFSSPTSFFVRVPADIPVLRDDLQFHAKGCYSANSEVKTSNRLSENALLRAEAASVLSAHLCGHTYPAKELRRGWEDVLFHQFHDVLDGCSIREAYDDAAAFYGEALAVAARAENTALQKLSWRIHTIGDHPKEERVDEATAARLGYPIVVCNPTPYEVTAAVTVRTAVSGRFPCNTPEKKVKLRQLASIAGCVTDETGAPVPLQTVRDSKTDRCYKYISAFLATVPPFGYRVYRAFDEERGEEETIPFTVDGTTVSNRRLRLSFSNTTGELTEIFDLKTGKPLLARETSIRLLDDEANDTWAHGAVRLGEEVPVEVRGTARVVELGPVCVTVLVEQTFGNSRMERRYTLLPDDDTISVSVKVDFREPFRVLKLALPLRDSRARATASIPFGQIARPADGTEQVFGSWVALEGKEGGIAVTTDSRHSYDADGDTLSVTALRSTLYADHYGERDEFCEHMDMGERRFRYAIFPYSTPADAERRASALAHAPIVLPETFHAGDLPTAFSGLSVAPANIAVTAIKQAADGNGWVLRCHETDGKDTEARITLFGTEICFRISHHSVKTFRIVGTEVTETDFLE